MSGGNNNVTVAIPGQENWAVWWVNELDNFQLDIVGFLAVLGEASVLANAQVSALSRLFYLPRILPAPQALLYTTRPTALPATQATVSGVESGNVKENVQHIASILLGKPMDRHTVRCVEVKKTDDRTEQRWTDVFFRGQPKLASNQESGHEPKDLDDAGSSKESVKEREVRPPLVKAKAFGPLTWVTLIGFTEAVVLFIASIVFGDGMSIVATILLSGLSTVIGAINKWNLELTQRPKGNKPTPRGDTVIRYPNGSFLVVRCTEEIARELYFAPEKIDYTLKND